MKRLILAVVGALVLMAQVPTSSERTLDLPTAATIAQSDTLVANIANAHVRQVSVAALLAAGGLVTASLTPGDCVQVGAGPTLTSVSGACLTTNNAVTSILAGPGVAVTGSTTPTVSLASPLPTTCPSAPAGWNGTTPQIVTGGGCLNQLTAGSGIAITAATGPNATVSLASPSPTSAPSSCAGYSASFIPAYFPCLGAVTAGSNIVVNSQVVSLASPTATTCPSAIVGTNSTYGQTYTAPTVAGGCPAFTSQSKIAFTIVVAANGTASPGLYSQPVTLSPDYVNPMADAISLYCSTPGYGASQTVAQFYESTPGPTGAPTLSTANPVGSPIALPTGTSQAAYATFAPTSLPTNSTAGSPTYIFATFKTVSGTPCSGNLTFQLHGLQRLIQ